MTAPRLSKRGSAIIDPRTNQLFVTDIVSKLDEIRQLIQKTDIATRQVLIEARLVEANDAFSRNLGAKLGFSDLRGLRGGDPGYGIGGKQPRALGGHQPASARHRPDAGQGRRLFQPVVNLPAAAIAGFSPSQPRVFAVLPADPAS